MNSSSSKKSDLDRAVNAVLQAEQEVKEGKLLKGDLDEIVEKID